MSALQESLASIHQQNMTLKSEHEMLIVKDNGPEFQSLQVHVVANYCHLGEREGERNCVQMFL